MVTASNKVAPKATKLVLQCKNCSDQKHLTMHAGLKGIMLPRTCERNGTRQAEEAACPMDPYEILPDSRKRAVFGPSTLVAAASTLPLRVASWAPLRPRLEPIGVRIWYSVKRMRALWD